MKGLWIYQEEVTKTEKNDVKGKGIIQNESSMCNLHVCIRVSSTLFLSVFRLVSAQASGLLNCLTFILGRKLACGLLSQSSAQVYALSGVNPLFAFLEEKWKDSKKYGIMGPGSFAGHTQGWCVVA